MRDPFPTLRREYLERHSDLATIEFYLCGPRPTIQAGCEILKTMNAPAANIATTNSPDVLPASRLEDRRS
ncbi:MAG TPA: hypothetical protein VEA63_12995 [Opitutus sp.]|nr:hypothetical protein [Opitutus sp.]